MNNLNENNINIFVLPSNDEIITTSNIDQNLDDENNIDSKYAISYRIFAATIRIFFLNTILDLYLHSDHYYGVNEALLSSALGVPTAIITTHKSRRPIQQYVLVKIKEQHLTNTCQSLLCLITMTGPFLKCYSLISRAVLADVFIGIGWDSVEVNTITYRLLHLIRDLNHMKLDDLLLRLSRKQTFFYNNVAWFCSTFYN
ncbi:unnamed protein product, partial [Rotaria sp. Silwood1]